MKKEELKDFCKSIGIDCVGIAGVGPYYDLEKIIKQRLFNGYTTGMEEPIIEKRVNPKETMENVKWQMASYSVYNLNLPLVTCHLPLK